MAVFWLVSYVLLVAAVFMCVVLWARRAKRELNDPSMRDRVTPVKEFLNRELPGDFYVSVQFCMGIAVAAIIASALYGYFAQS